MLKEENSRRVFFKKTAAAVGVVVAAVFAKTLISVSGSTNEAGEKYVNDAALQEKMLSQSELVMMTGDEKKQRLDEILGSHDK